MSIRRLPIVLGLILATVFSLPASAGVVVLTSRVKDRVAFTLVQANGQETHHNLDRGEVISEPVTESITVVFDNGDEPCRCTLQANGIYYFDSKASKLDLLQYPLPDAPSSSTTSPAQTESVCTIPVKILVDDNEPTAQRVWEKRYRQRLAEASEIIERHCRVRFDVVAVGVWASDDSTHNLNKLIDDFERKVKPEPARLAIGFTGRYQTFRIDNHMGGTRGPFRSHILIREWGRQITESERLEILVHELGHFLGAVHSAEVQSVMRPDLGDRQARARAFRIGFDARNTLAMYLVGEELRRRPLTYLGQLPLTTRNQLRAVYASLAAALPTDPAAPGYLGMLNLSRSPTGERPEP